MVMVPPLGMAFAGVNTMLTAPVVGWFPTLSASTSIKPMPPLTLLLSVTTGAPEPKVSTIEVKLPVALTAGTGPSMFPFMLTMAAFTLLNAPCTALGFVMPATVNTIAVLPLIAALNITVSTKDELMLAVAAAPAAGCKNVTAHPVQDSPAPERVIKSMSPSATAVTGVNDTVIVTPELPLMLLLSVTAGAPAPRLFSTMATNVPVVLVSRITPALFMVADCTAAIGLCAELGFTTPGIVNAIAAPAAKSASPKNVIVSTF